jgi:hypothetical protein
VISDLSRITLWDKLRQRSLAAFSHLLQSDTLAGAAARAGLPVIKGPLHAGNLAWLAILCALHGTKNFAQVLGLIVKLLSLSPDARNNPLAKLVPPQLQRQTNKKRNKHHPHGSDPQHITEEAFVQARQRLPLAFWTALIMLLCERFETEHGPRLRWKKFRLLALDGTTINLPKWKRLADHFGTANNGKASRTTQARMVLLQFPLARMPWRYELTPLAEGERTVASRLLENLSIDDLVLIDRGFWSYGLFQQIVKQQAHFAIRQMGGAALRTKRWLGRGDRLVRCKPSDRQWKKAGLPLEIELRVISYQVRGFRPSAVVTSVLDPQTISREDWIEMASVNEAGQVLEGGLYHRRWEIETTFAELKVTQGMEGNLRGRTPKSIEYEVAGHVLLYLLVRWLIVEAATEHDVAGPRRLSFVNALRELEDMRAAFLYACPKKIEHILLPRLLKEIAGHQVPFRPGRHYPRPHDTKYKNKGRGNPCKPSKLSEAINTGNKKKQKLKAA